MTHHCSKGRRFVGPLVRLSAAILSVGVTLLSLYAILGIASLEPGAAATPVIAKATAVRVR